MTSTPEHGPTEQPPPDDIPPGRYPDGVVPETERQVVPEDDDPQSLAEAGLGP